MISLFEFRDIGREQRYARRPAWVQFVVRLFGSLGIHSRIRAGHVLKHVRRLPLPLTAHIFDAGCGHGLVLFWLAQRYPEYHLDGVEIDPDLVKDVQRIAISLHIPALSVTQGDLTTLDSVGETYDLIISVDVLEHIEDDDKVLRLFRQRLKPTGTLLLHLPLRHQLQWRFFPAFKRHIIADHVRDEYTPAEIQSKLEATGFTVRQINCGFGRAGELAFELNTLFWTKPLLRAFFAALTYPISWWLAYWDVNSFSTSGNSLIILAIPKASAAGD